MQLVKATLVVVFIAVTLQSVNSSPASSHNSQWIGGQLIIRKQQTQCFELPKALADYCNYTHTLLPNPRGHETVEEAQGEFNDFTALLNSNCSLYIGTFLCFFYFPWTSGCSADSNNNVQPITILPCKETCLAAKTEACTQIVKASPVGGWVDHLDCELRDNIASSNSKCAYGNNTRTYYNHTLAEKPKNKGPKDLDGSGSGESSTEKETTQEPSVDPVTVEETTEEKTRATTPTLETQTTEPPTECPKKCDTRTKATGGTFKRNDYTFAAKVTVLRKLTNDFGRHTYEVNVLKSYDVKTECDDSTNSLIAGPSMGNIVHGNYQDCDQMSLLSSSVGTNEEILIAGVHQEDSDGSIKFVLECDDKPLVAPWASKYAKRMQGWVEAGNRERASRCQ